ncbi:expressed unknown protein [Seminavis robusta]|uniref:Uncharacterized protein n=1 Tax=Seminavis robusta TaxID=568900 RepID=A0A9N8EVD5_9STRA|nr:expressed unknown protein [Seminavis robusta]|eukprot:Sro1794_g297960.1 n/a (670) ;mRNA; r:12204-14688
MPYPPQQQVIEVVEYVDDDDWDGDEDDYEEVVEIVEQVVTVPKQNFSAVAAYEVGIGAPPPLFLTPKEKAQLTAQETQKELAAASPQYAQQQYASQQQSQEPMSPTKRAMKPQASSRLSMLKHQSIINQALDLPDGIEEEEIIEEEIIEEEYEEYEEEYEEEYIEEEYYDDEEYIIEEIIEETEEEAKARQQLEAEIAEIERQIAEAKEVKGKRMAEGGVEETSKEKAERMAHNSRLQACKQMKVETDFKRKAAARAKVLAEREKNWGKKGKKKQKDLSEIIASKAKKQKKLVARAKTRDSNATKKTATPAAKPEAPKAEEPQKEHKQLSMAEMLAQKVEKGKGGMVMGKAKPSKQVQSAAADDFGDDDLKLEDFMPSDDEEEEEQEPELTPEEEHKKRLQWEKPNWTQAKLRTTTKGNKIKAGKYISAPITNIPKKINEGLEEDEDDAPSKGALMKGAMKMVALPKVKKHQAGLNFTGNGARIRDGRQIEKQINPKVNKDKEEVKIWGADPEELKLTPRGLTARKGKVLSDDNITQATQLKKYQFEKPSWAKTKKDHLLKHTETGEQLKEGEDIAPKITEAVDEKKYTFEKPSWTKAKLKNTDQGEKVKSGEYLSAPIVVLDKKTMNVNMEANPAFLRMTDQGEKLMEEGNLEAPITAAPELAKQNRR